MRRNIDAAADDIQRRSMLRVDKCGGRSSPPSYRKVNAAHSPIMILFAADAMPLTEVDDNLVVPRPLIDVICATLGVCAIGA
jgi:hypothetical protein